MVELTGHAQSLGGSRLRFPVAKLTLPKGGTTDLGLIFLCGSERATQQYKRYSSYLSTVDKPLRAVPGRSAPGSLVQQLHLLLMREEFQALRSNHSAAWSRPFSSRFEAMPMAQAMPLLLLLMPWVLSDQALHYHQPSASCCGGAEASPSPGVIPLCVNESNSKFGRFAGCCSC